MLSRLNVLSITGVRKAPCSEKCGNTVCEKASTRSALYCGDGETKMHIRVTTRTLSHFLETQAALFGHDEETHSSPEGCESAAGCRAGVLAWRAASPADLLPPLGLPGCRTAPTSHPRLKSSHSAPSSTRRRSRG